MKRYPLLAVVASMLFVGTAILAEEAKEEKIELKGIKCVVSGGPAKEGTDVEYKGAKLFFCCKNCPKAFEKDKKKFAAKANHQITATKQAREVKCPFSGRDLNKETAIEVSGVKVAFCCNNCKGKAEKAEGDEQIELIFNEKAFETGFKTKKQEQEEKEKQEKEEA